MMSLVYTCIYCKLQVLYLKKYLSVMCYIFVYRWMRHVFYLNLYQHAKSFSLRYVMLSVIMFLNTSKCLIWVLMCFFVLKYFSISKYLYLYKATFRLCVHEYLVMHVLMHVLCMAGVHIEIFGMLEPQNTNTSYKGLWTVLHSDFDVKRKLSYTRALFRFLISFKLIMLER